MSEKMKIKTPIGELLYVAVRGTGAQNYDGDGYEYKASIKLPKKDGKKLYKKIVDFFNENKPSKCKDDAPANNIYHKTDDGDMLFTFKTKVEFDGKPVKVRIYNSKNEEKEPPEGTLIGNGSKGVISGQLAVYSNKKGDNAGVSMFLNGIQLAKFVPYVPDSGFDEIDGEFEDFDNADFPDQEKSKKKKKGKKKKGKKKKD